MAKSTNGIGQFRGKMGAAVFSVRNGQQIVRTYQPAVANPKTIEQRLQRAKANLVGQISKITPYQILIALGSSKASRRARFLRLALNAATARVSESDSSVINAKLDAPNFVYAEGALIPTIGASNVVAAAETISFRVNRRAGVSDADFLASGVLAVATLLSANGKYEKEFFRFIDASELSGGYLDVSFSHTIEGAYSTAVYIAPFATTDGTTLRTRASQLFGENADFAASMYYNPSALPLVWGNSNLISVAEYTPA